VATLPSRREEVQLPSPEVLDQKAQRSAFYLRLNQLQKKRPRRLIIRQKSIKELKFFKQELSRQAHVPKELKLERQITERSVEETPLWVKARK